MVNVRATDEYDRWLNGLRDAAARARITRYFERIEDGGTLTGDLKAVGGHVVEVRFHFGPGYRVHLTQVGSTVVLLLVGGDKSTQARDIARARELAEEWRRDAEDPQV